MLEITGLQAGYGAFQVLRGVELSIGAGEIAAVLGANGAGKTTLNRAISGLIRPDGGRIRFDGHDITGADPARIVASGLIHVPEGRLVFPDLTVAENLRLGAYRRGGARRRVNLDRVIAIFPRLAERLSQRAGLMSGGEQQMLAIARSLMAEPRMLILDEPSLGLSPLLTEQLFALIARLHDAGLTILIVEQNVVQTLTVASRGFVLENGRIVLSGEADALLNNQELRSAYLGV